MYLPLLITVHLSATALISFNLCVMMITDFPSFVISFIIEINSSISLGVNTAVGSSNINTFAFLYNILSISTLCCIPTEISSIFAYGSTFNPYCLDNSSILLAAVLISTTKPFLGSHPRVIFSVTVKFSTSLKCW